MAQRKLAFQVFASQIPPSVYFPADTFVVNQSPLTVLAKFAQQEMSCSPVWMAHILNRLASFSISQPCLAACFQGTENIVFSCKNTNGNAEFSGGFQFLKKGWNSSEQSPLPGPAKSHRQSCGSWSSSPATASSSSCLWACSPESWEKATVRRRATAREGPHLHGLQNSCCLSEEGGGGGSRSSRSGHASDLWGV